MTAEERCREWATLARFDEQTRREAARIAQELESELGKVVGYKIRFTDRTSPQSYVKLMTDGILLAETQGDP